MNKNFLENIIKKWFDGTVIFIVYFRCLVFIQKSKDLNDRLYNFELHPNLIINQIKKRENYDDPI